MKADQAPAIAALPDDILAALRPMLPPGARFAVQHAADVLRRIGHADAAKSIDLLLAWREAADRALLARGIRLTVVAPAPDDCPTADMLDELERICLARLPSGSGYGILLLDPPGTDGLQGNNYTGNVALADAAEILHALAEAYSDDAEPPKEPAGPPDSGRTH